MHAYHRLFSFSLVGTLSLLTFRHFSGNRSPGIFHVIYGILDARSVIDITFVAAMKLSDTEAVEIWQRHKHCNVTAMKVTNSLLSLLDRHSRPIILLLLSMFRNTRGGFIWITQATLSDSDHIISKGTLSYSN